MSTELETLDIDGEITPEYARQLCWERGILAFKLDKNQQEMSEAHKNNQGKITVWNTSRRLGKSYTLCVIAIETCLQNRNGIVKFLAPTQKMIRELIRPLMREITADAPDDIRPKEVRGEWIFPSTGSKIQFAGCDGGRAQNVRGTNALMSIIDEAGFVAKDLEHIVNSILLPTMLTTNGKLLLSSTPPESPDHEFVSFLIRARANKAAVEKTIFDNPRLTKKQIDEMAEAIGGYESIAFRREYLAHIIKDGGRSIVPEFDDILKTKIVKEWKRPGKYDRYVSMDVGMKDLTVVLFGYLDFIANKLIIEDEFVINGQKLTTEALAEGIKKIEEKLWRDPLSGEISAPKKRVSDNNLILIQDLHRMHDLIFWPTQKDDAMAALNNMRILIKNEQIIINPRCKILVSHLDSGTWNKAKTSYERSKYRDDATGELVEHHYDAIDSLKYLVRNVNFNDNPYPGNYYLPKGDGTHYMTEEARTGNTQASIWKRLMNLKKQG